MKNISKKKAPLLFNLAELQAECAKRFKISPDETLQVAQDLYEKKLTTYPRTDARVLSTAVAKEIYKNISKLKGYDVVSPYVEEILIFEYQGMFNKPGTIAFCGHPDSIEYYKDYKKLLDEIEK